MSWSVYGTGKAKALAAKVEEEFVRGGCSEPEESVRQCARQTIAAALAAHPPDFVVSVAASGSQSQEYGKDGTPLGRFSNSLKIEITPHGAFVE
jgi:hypothetical protein